jgi:hypothetical protein
MNRLFLIVVIIGVMSCSDSRVNDGMCVSSGRARDLRLPLVGIHKLIIAGSAVHPDRIETGELLVFKEESHKIWYRVNVIDGSPVGQLVEYYDNGSIRMVAVYDAPGSTKSQVYFSEDGKITVQ